MWRKVELRTVSLWSEAILQSASAGATVVLCVVKFEVFCFFLVQCDREITHKIMDR